MSSGEKHLQIPTFCFILETRYFWGPESLNVPEISLLLNAVHPHADQKLGVIGKSIFCSGLLSPWCQPSNPSRLWCQFDIRADMTQLVLPCDIKHKISYHLVNTRGNALPSLGIRGSNGTSQKVMSSGSGVFWEYVYLKSLLHAGNTLSEYYVTSLILLSQGGMECVMLAAVCNVPWYHFCS